MRITYFLAYLLHAGARAVGGTSTINGLLYGRGSSGLYDNWEAIGNPGWDWNSVFPYFVKVGMPGGLGCSEGLNSLYRVQPSTHLKA